jgi:hypothetical protein
VDYPLKIQTIYIDSFQGMAWQHIFCKFYKYSTVTVFSSGDPFGRMATIENQDETFCHITHLATVIVDAGSTDVAALVAQAKYSGSNVFVFFMSTEYTTLAAEIISMGVETGLFKEGIQLIGSEQITNDVLFTTLDSKGVDVKKAMKGYLSMRNLPNYNLMNTPAGTDFIDRWRNQSATQWKTAKQILCNQARDDPDLKYIYRNGVSVLDNHTCLGLDYASFHANGSDIAPYVGNTYDATYLLAYGINEVVSNSAPVNGITLHDAIIDTVEFTGVSGPIDIYEGEAVVILLIVMHFFLLVCYVLYVLIYYMCVNILYYILYHRNGIIAQ